MLSLALTKFWHATSHESDNKPHMQQYIDNLICKIHNTIQDDQSFKVFSSPDSGSMILEVLHKGVVLERLDVTAKIASSGELMVTTASQGMVDVAKSQLPIIGLCQSKQHTLALRYNLEDQMVRRTQLAFSRNDQYEHVLSLLRSTGIDFTEKSRPESRNVSRPTTTPVARPRPVARPQIQSSFGLPRLDSNLAPPIVVPTFAQNAQNVQHGMPHSHGHNAGSRLPISVGRFTPPVNQHSARPGSAMSMVSTLDRIDEHQTPMPPPQTTNIRNIHSSGQATSRPALSTGSVESSASISSRGFPPFFEPTTIIDSSPLPPRRELPFQRPATAPQQQSVTNVATPPITTTAARPSTIKKQTPAAKRAASSATGNAKKRPASKGKVTQRSQSMAIQVSQQLTTAVPEPIANPTEPTAIENPAAWNDQSLTMMNVDSPTTMTLDSLRGFGHLQESEKETLVEAAVRTLEDGLNDDFIAFCVALEGNLTARLKMKNILGSR